MGTKTYALFGSVFIIIVFVVGIGLMSNISAENKKISSLRTLDSHYIEDQIHLEVNKVRFENNLQPLVKDFHLKDIARKHSKDMAMRDYFEHESPDGLTFLDRYQDNGYKCEIVTSQFIARGGENLMFIMNGFSNEDIVKRTINGWLDSPGHKENLMTDYYTKQGIGVSLDGNEIYITQNFC